MIFILYDKILDQTIIPNGFNLSLDEYNFHAGINQAKKNPHFTHTNIRYFANHPVIPLSISSFLANPDYWLSQGKVFYIIALARNIKDYTDIFQLGINSWINSIDKDILAQIQTDKITLVLESLYEDVDMPSLQTVISVLKIQGITNFQVWTCYTPPDDKWSKKYDLEDKLVDLPYQEKITIDLYSLQNINNVLRSKKFVYLCRRTTAERLGCFNYLIVNNLLESGYVSIPSIDTMSGQPLLQTLGSSHLGLDKPTIRSLTTFFENNPQGLTLDSKVILDRDRVVNNESFLGFSSAPELEKYYADSYLSLICEGSLAPNQWMITEKTFRAMIYKHLFFIIGPQHILKALRKKGYQTFNDIWSEKYDDVVDDTQRIWQALDEFKKVMNGDLSATYQAAKPILEHNYNLVFEKANQKINL